ncbi:TetR/AcrR family transcriptional regulator [Singulisphaera acidiphila]|uniref:Transcriptional regulator n=1 Tax=Singulisphaera acidiphila (strain ATCC BAA-1392 / DSM 18658 / VKM B-2454 / MOB10) TaxID=886293 RepID=L0DNJ3_SINAD|nr:TetR/AcrR family transcriptional regulator [Singulisphaera acidiphila]AGA30385.1 transcriptional regulator [Singulisphaera acidiphila DSM 18658]
MFLSGKKYIFHAPSGQVGYAGLMGRKKGISEEQIVVAARRCFLTRGAGVSAADVARELGVSHTTLFNRFGTKEGLMIAALGLPEKVPWVAALDAGPDDRPIYEQLVEHSKVISAYILELEEGLAVLQAAGISPAKTGWEHKGDPPHVQALRALTTWLRRAQDRGRLAKCDVETLASTILGALHGWAFFTRVCGHPESAAAGERHVERFIDLLWNGIGGGRT